MNIVNDVYKIESLDAFTMAHRNKYNGKLILFIVTETFIDSRFISIDYW